LSEVPNN